MDEIESNRFAVFAGAAGVFCLVVWPWESWEIFVMDGEVLRLLTGRLGYHANWKYDNKNIESCLTSQTEWDIGVDWELLADPGWTEPRLRCCRREVVFKTYFRVRSHDEEGKLGYRGPARISSLGCI